VSRARPVVRPIVATDNRDGLQVGRGSEEGTRALVVLRSAAMTPATALSASEPTLEQRFARYQRLTVRQKKRWLEILLSFEVKNTYEVFDEQGAPALRVREQGAGIWSLLKRLFLGTMRPFRVLVTDVGTGQALLELHRPFRFVFHRLEVRTAQGESIGAIQKKWSWIRRIYHVESQAGHTVAELFGPLLKPWTFEIRTGDRAVGLVQKRWSGLGKEMFTDADNFGVDLANVSDPRLKVLAFAAVVLIDIVHFEKAKG
jgi:uncharacterized protein YxjI